MAIEHTDRYTQLDFFRILHINFSMKKKIKSVERRIEKEFEIKSRRRNNKKSSKKDP